MRPVIDPRFTNGQVWEAFKGNWVWETGFTYDVSPIRLWVEVCDISYNNVGLSISDPIYSTFLFKSYMSVAGDNTDLNRFIVALRSRMLTYDLKPLYLYLAMFMAINGGILLSEEDLLAALIL